MIVPYGMSSMWISLLSEGQPFLYLLEEAKFFDIINISIKVFSRILEEWKGVRKITSERLLML